MFPKIELIELDNPHVRGAAIEVLGRRERIFVLPFPKHGLKQAFALSDRIVLFVAEGRRRDTYQELLVAKFDIKNEQITQTATLEVAGVSPRLQLSKDRRWLYSMGNGISVIDLDGLSVWRLFDTALLRGRRGKLVKRSDYFRIDPAIKDGDARVFHSKNLRDEYCDPSNLIVFLSTSNLHCDRGPNELVLLNDHIVYAGGAPFGWRQSRMEADLETGSVRCIEIVSGKETEKRDRGLIFLSMAGQFGLSKVTTEIPVSSGTNDASVAAFGRDIPDIGEHFDVQRDGAKRFGIELNYWDLTCEPPVSRRHIVRMATAEELNRKVMTGSHLPREPLSDGEFERALIFETFRQANPQDRELLAHRPTRKSAALKDVPIRLPFDISSKALSGYIRDVFDEPGTDAYWVLFSDCSIRRVSSTGMLGPIIVLRGGSEFLRINEVAVRFDPGGRLSITRRDVGTYRIDPDDIDLHARRIEIDVTTPSAPVRSYRGAFKAFVRAKTASAVVLKDWKRDACAMALREQRARIETQYEILLAGSEYARTLEFRYVVGEESYEEAVFFQRLVDEWIDVVPELRALLTTYLHKLGSGGEGRQPWKHGESGTSALAHAMRALVLLDPDSLDIFRTFLAKRDGEHEGYCRETIMPDYVSAHGWRDRAALRFGIYFTLNLFWGGLMGGSVNSDGLMSAAAGMVEASEFADMVLAEAAAFNLNPQWNDQDEEHYIACFFAGLDKKEPFEAEVREALTRLRPGLEAVEI
jgi:hypothetical protein